MLPTPPSIPVSRRALSVGDDLPSLLHAALPASIQSRIPKLSSIRRTVRIQAAFFRSDASTIVSDTAPDDPVVDPALDQTLQGAMDADVATPGGSPRRGTNGWAWRNASSGGSAAELGLVLAGSAGPVRSSLDASQVNWKYGQNGFRALENAMREASDADRLPELERQIYIESVAYLLRGMPSDLHDREVEHLRQAAPDGLLGVLPESRRLAPGDAQHAQPDMSGTPRQRSLPHMITHWLITRVYAAVMLLVPLAASLVRLVIDLDRKYHVPEVLMAWGLGTLLMLYKGALELFTSVCSMGDGRIGRALDDGAAYMASGMASGFREAVVDVARRHA